MKRKEERMIYLQINSYRQTMQDYHNIYAGTVNQLYTSWFFVSQNTTQCSTLSGLVKAQTTVLAK